MKWLADMNIMWRRRYEKKRGDRRGLYGLNWQPTSTDQPRYTVKYDDISEKKFIFAIQTMEKLVQPT